MARILVMAPQTDMRERICESLKEIKYPLVAVVLRSHVVRLLNNIRQVLVYAAYQGDDVGWVAEQMEAHSELRVVYLSPNPWASLNYERARCMVALHSPDALDSSLLRRMVLDLLPRIPDLEPTR